VTTATAPETDAPVEEGEGHVESPEDESPPSPATPPLEHYVDLSWLTPTVMPLPDIRYEERDSYYPRPRFCYHPDEYDDVELLPGPGIVDLPDETTTAAAVAGFSGHA